MLSLLSLVLASGPAQAGSTWTVVMPFGVPQFTHGESKRGWIYLGAQTALAGLTTWSSVSMWNAAVDGRIDEELTLRLVSAGAVAGWSGVYVASVIDGARLHQFEDASDEEPFGPLGSWAPHEVELSRELFAVTLHRPDLGASSVGVLSALPPPPVIGWTPHPTP